MAVLIKSKFGQCDGRCTQAKGNHCACICGGTNHGIEANRREGADIESDTERERPRSDAAER